MTADARLDAILDRCLAAPHPRPTAHEDDLRTAEQTGPIPEALRRLYRRTDGLAIGVIEVFDLDDYEHINAQKELFGELPGVAFFASDRSDGYFLIDESDGLGRGPGRIYWADRGNLSADACVPCAPDLAAFLAAVERGERPWSGRNLGELAVDELAGLIAGHPNRVDARPGLDPSVLDRTCHEQKLPLPPGLAAVLERANGLRIAASGREIFPLERIRPVAGTDNGLGGPGALWVGRDSHGAQYAVSLGGWRGLPADRLVAAARGASVAEAPVLGRVAEVIAGWIIARTGG